MTSTPDRGKFVSSDLSVSPTLPMSITMPDGREYSVAGEVWALPEDPHSKVTVVLNWSLLTNVIFAGTSKPVLSLRAVSFVKLYVLERMSASKKPLKPASALNNLGAALRFARWLSAHIEWLPANRSFDWADLTEEIFDAWLDVEYQSKSKGDSVNRLRKFFIWGAESGAGRTDFSAALASVLSGKGIKGHARGQLVKSRDKRRGPFTRDELDIIYKPCRAGAGTNRDRAIVWTLLETVIRPKQMFKLTNQDLEVITDNSKRGQKRVMYRLRVRKIKRPSNTIEYHYLPLSEGCARLLLDVQKQDGKPSDPLFWWISNNYNKYITRRLRAFSVDADLRSPRLPIEHSEPGDPVYELLHLTARRFRYGVSSDRIARRELPENVAEMLGHKGTECVDVYVETSPGIADDFQLATDYVITHLIDLMLGRAQPSEVYLSNAVPPITSKLRRHSEAQVFKLDTAARHSRQGGLLNIQSDLGVRSGPTTHQSEIRIKELIARARGKFPKIYIDQGFNAQIWNVARLRDCPSASHIINFGFTTLTSNIGLGFSDRLEDALPPYFADVIKSWLVFSSVSLEVNALRLHAARFFWSFLSTQQGRQIESFVWGELKEDDILAFEHFLMAYRSSRGKPLKSSTLFNILGRIQCLINFLTSRGICRYIEYFPQTQPTRPGSMSLAEKRLMAERKLPAPGILEALADTYHLLTTAPAGQVSDWEIILISAVAILLLTGLRIGELVTMPFDCEVEEKVSSGSDGSDSFRYGIRYWLEKAPVKAIRIRWISPTAEPVVRESISRIKRLTAAARERTKVLENDPTRVSLPADVAGRDTITRAEAIALLGYKEDRSINHDTQGLLPQQGVGPNSYFYVKDLEALLMSRRVPELYTMRNDDGTYQMLSQSLFIVFSKQSQYRTTNCCRLLVEPIRTHSISNYLSTPTGLFRTHDEWKQRTNMLPNPHSLRHWLIHVAYMGGMESHLILRYFAKNHIGCIADYLHFFIDESAAYVPEELRAQTFYVPE
ncbi:MAG: hypothetical protein LC803_08920 [Acidobacteria bacterium]|nr:hypothetical protein [Acidobacteriota bacterium]